MTIDTDVLIVGAGPVGLFLANECARRGIRNVVMSAGTVIYAIASAPRRAALKATQLSDKARMIEQLDSPSVQQW